MKLNISLITPYDVRKLLQWPLLGLLTPLQAALGLALVDGGIAGSFLAAHSTSNNLPVNCAFTKWFFNVFVEAFSQNACRGKPVRLV